MDQQSSQPMLGAPVASASDQETEERKAGGVNATYSLVKRPHRGLFLSLVIAIAIIAALAIALSISLIKNKGDTDLCLSPQCIRSAFNILESMDNSIQPCDNFYKFACGRWNREHFIRDYLTQNNWFMERTWLAEKDARDYLKQADSEDEPKTVHLARAMYRSCLNFDDTAHVGIETLIDLFGKIGIRFRPPITKKSLQPWMRTLAKTKKYLGMDVLIGVGLTRNPTNNTVLKITIAGPNDPPLTSIKSKVKKVEDQVSVIFPWKEGAIKIMKYFLEVQDAADVITNEQVEQAAHDLMEMTDFFVDLEKSKDIVEADQSNIPEEMTVKELQNLVDTASARKSSRINWKQYFLSLYDGVGIKLDLDGKDTILVYNKEYFQQLSKSLDDLDERKLELLIWWKIVYTVGLHVNYEIWQLKKDLDSSLDSIKSTSRSSLCSEIVTNLMKVAVSYRLTQQPNIEEMRQKVREMIENIQFVFADLVRQVSWMDEETKERTLEKVAAMEKQVAFFEWMKNRTAIDLHYGNITIHESTHLLNLINILQLDTFKTLRELREPYNSKLMPFDFLDVNAFYNLNDNSISVPSGILQFPFYDLGLEALNYGSIGVILGHELTHGFDDTGRMYDKAGNLNEWWTEESDKEYQNRIKCYVDKYSTFDIPSLNKTINGDLTLGENLADNGGLIEALLAYRNYVTKNGKEKKLPGLVQYTSEQLFFLSYANTWCSEYTGESLLDALEDEHSPDFVRTLIALQNSEEFARSWSCPVGSYMNPSHNKCRLWVD